jgi:hypothetical protein
VGGIISPGFGVPAPFSPLRKRAEMDAFFFHDRGFLGDDDFALAFGAFARTFFRFAMADR